MTYHSTRTRVGIALVGSLTALALASCGQPEEPKDPPTSAVPATPSSTPSTSTTATPTSSKTPAKPKTTLAHAGDKCGVVTVPGGDRFRLTVRKGKVNCSKARHAFRAYIIKLRGGEAPGNGGGGPIRSAGWTCASGSAVDPGSTCTKGGNTFVATPL